MKIVEVQVGGRYIAKVSGVLTTVRVLGMREVAPWTRDGRWQTRIDVVNERTGRKTSFASAAKLRRPAQVANPAATPAPNAQVQP